MLNYLSFNTESLFVCIDKYEEFTFNYLGWKVSDNYIYNKNSPSHSQYTIMITSPYIANLEELNNSSLLGKKIASIITELIPISGLPSLNSPKFKSFSNNLEIVDYKSAPYGWKTDFNEIQSKLYGEKSNKLTLNCTLEGFCHPAKLEKSPLFDIQQMLEHYDDAEEHIKFLLFLNNSIETANDINVYMLIGKALEIVFAIGAYSEQKWNNKRPIKSYFPELSEVLQDVTFGNLFEMTNFRKESRHYVDNKKKYCKPHESLSNEEKIKLYRCSINLIINVIRHSFGLPYKSVNFK